MLLKFKLQRLEHQLNFFTTRTPADYYAYGRWRVERLFRTRPQSFQVDLPALEQAIAPHALSSAFKNDKSLPRAIAIHFKWREQPRYFFDTDDLSGLVSLIPEEEKQETIRQANAVLDQRFHFRQVTQQFTGKIDWQFTPQGNVDWRWDLNRHGFFITLGRAYAYTGDEQYALKFRELLSDWIEQNPPSTDQPNWNSVFEVACRAEAWLASFYLFRRAPSFNIQTCLTFLCGLLAHAQYLDHNLERHVPNNHLLLEAKTLATLGLLLPECVQAAGWLERGSTYLNKQIELQVCRDGVHGERATMYHRIVAHALLEWLVLREDNGLPVPARLLSTLRSMFEFQHTLARPDGTLPLFGDSAAMDTHLKYSGNSAGELYCRNL